MSTTSAHDDRSGSIGGWLSWGLFWLVVACLGAGVFFADGLDALLVAWQTPEYSHGPLIPVLSALLFLRELKQYPPQPGPKNDRWIGVAVVLFSILVAVLGKLSNISDLVAYATIIWVAGILLISFGWQTGKHFWPPVLHLVYMLPLPGTIYYKVSTALQFISSELGVWFLHLSGVPVYLDGNIIDLGVLKLHVAEACSGLRYLFPILSFSYIFAVLYQGPKWHKAVLLLSAAPIAVFMNAVRIAIGGILVRYLGIEWLEGFSHFFEGWVIFLSCVMILFGLAWILLRFNPRRMGLVEALDLDTEGLLPQFARLQYVRPSPALITAAMLMAAAVGAWQLNPQRSVIVPDRDIFALFPRELGEWRQAGPRETLKDSVVRTLAADDYHSVQFVRSPGEPAIGFFSAWYKDQSHGGVHSPEVCLPGAGWEIAWLERIDISDELGTDRPFHINRAIIQKGEVRMMVYYWFEQKGEKLAWDFAAKINLLIQGVTTGRTDGALVRLTSLIGEGETEAEVEARMNDFMQLVVPVLPRFIPGA